MFSKWKTAYTRPDMEGCVPHKMFKVVRSGKFSGYLMHISAHLGPHGDIWNIWTIFNILNLNISIFLLLELEKNEKMIHIYEEAAKLRSDGSLKIQNQQMILEKLNL